MASLKMTQQNYIVQRLGAVGAATAVRQLAGSLTASIAWMRTRRRTRMALSELDQRMLADIGLTERAAQREAAKPFWRG